MPTDHPASRLEALDFTRDIARLTQDFTGRDWVMAKIDRWLADPGPRFFILTGEPGVGKSALAARLTQVRKDILAYHFCVAGRNSTITPGTALRSLAAQLGERLPGYGLALANSVKPELLSVSINLDVARLEGGQITGLVINNLKAADPRQTLDILLCAPLAAVLAPQAPSVILVDSLDEAVTYPGETNLVTLLASLDDLPAWVRFICTTRPERRVLRYFDALQPYTLAAESAMNLADLRHYVEARVQKDELQARLAAAGVDSAALAAQVVELSTGNFLYTKVLLNDIAAGQQPLADLASLPRSLDEIYHGFLLRLQAGWVGGYQPLLGVLAVARELVTEQQLAGFCGVGRGSLRQRLGVLRQFLDVSAENGAERYSLFHQSLRDYLTDGDRNQDFWCAPEEEHARITAYYLAAFPALLKGDLAGLDLSAPEPDDYGLRHLPLHLALARQAAGLHQLLGGPWALLKERRDYHLAGFLDDVKLAWQFAEQAGQPGLTLRYALFEASLRSLATNLPPRLLAALVRHGLRPPQAALRSVRQMTDEAVRAATLSALMPFIPAPLVDDLRQQMDGLSSAWHRAELYMDWLACEALPLQPQVVTEALELLRGQSSRLADRLPQFAKRLSESAREDLLGLVLDSAPEERAKGLAALLPDLPERLFSQAAEAILALPSDEPPIVPALVALARRYPAETALPVWQRALNLALGWPNTRAVGEAMAVIAPDLPAGLLPQAVGGVQGLRPGPGQMQALAALLPRCDEPTQKTLVSVVLKAAPQAGGSSTDPVTVRYLTALLPGLSSGLRETVWQAAQDEAAKIDWAVTRAMGLALLIPWAPDAQREKLVGQALEAVEEGGGNDFNRAEALLLLAPCLPASRQPELLKLALGLTDEVSRVKALVGVAAYLDPASLTSALGVAEALSSVTQRVNLIDSLAAFLPPSALPRAVALARAVQDVEPQAEAVVALALELPPGRCPLPPRECLQFALKISEPARRAETLWRLARWMPEPDRTQAWAGVLTALRELRGSYLVDALGDLGPDWPPGILADVLSFIDQFSVPSARDQALLALGTALPPERVAPLLAAVMASPLTDEQVKGLAVSLPHLPASEHPALIRQVLSKALRVSEASDPDAWAPAMLDVPVSEPSTLTELVMTKVHGVPRRDFCDAVVTLAPWMPAEMAAEVWQTVLALRTKDEANRARALVALWLRWPPGVPVQRPREAFDLVSTVGDWTLRADSLSRLVEAGALTPELAPEALAAARGIGDGGLRARALVGLLPALPADQQALAAQEALRGCRSSLPAEGLSILVRLAPLVGSEPEWQKLWQKNLAAAPHWRAEALLSRMPQLPEGQWPAQLVDALTSGARWAWLDDPARGAKERAQAWKDGPPLLQMLPAADARRVWQESLPALAARSRPDLLYDLAFWAPTLKALFGESYVAEALKCIVEAIRLWP